MANQIIQKRERKKIFQTWLSDEDIEILSANAGRCGMSKSGYVRSLIQGNVPREAPSGDFVSILKELKLIGRNINQIAYVANSTGLIDAEAYNEEMRKLKDKIFEIERCVYYHGDN